MWNHINIRFHTLFSYSFLLHTYFTHIYNIHFHITFFLLFSFRAVRHGISLLLTRSQCFSYFFFFSFLCAVSFPGLFLWLPAICLVLFLHCSFQWHEMNVWNGWLMTMAHCMLRDLFVDGLTQVNKMLYISQPSLVKVLYSIVTSNFLVIIPFLLCCSGRRR